MKSPKINTGIHTYSVSTALTAKQYYKIKDHFENALRQEQSDYWMGKERYVINQFEKQGIKFYLSHFQKLYRLKIRIEPCRVLGGDNPAALYQPSRKSYKEMGSITNFA